MRIHVRPEHGVAVEPPRTLPPLAPPPPATALRLPPVAQPNDYTCGPASGLSVLRYAGKVLALDQVIAQMGTTEDGTDYEPIADALCKHGLDAKVSFTLTHADLIRHASRGDPVIICFNAWPNDGHYSVVVAADERGVWLMDPYMPDEDGTLARGFVPASELPGRFYEDGSGAGIIVRMRGRPVEERAILHARRVE